MKIPARLAGMLAGVSILATISTSAVAVPLGGSFTLIGDALGAGGEVPIFRVTYRVDDFDATDPGSNATFALADSLTQQFDLSGTPPGFVGDPLPTILADEFKVVSLFDPSVVEFFEGDITADWDTDPRLVLSADFLSVLGIVASGETTASNGSALSINLFAPVGGFSSGAKGEFGGDGFIPALNASITVSGNQVPEPAPMALLGAGVLALAFVRRRRIAARA